MVSLKWEPSWGKQNWSPGSGPTCVNWDYTGAVDNLTTIFNGDSDTSKDLTYYGG